MWHPALIGLLSVAVIGYGLLNALTPTGVSPGVREDFRRDAWTRRVTLLIVTLLAWSAYRARTGSLRMHLLGLGPMLYYAYSYVINAFSPYNDVFVPCVVLIGMPAYALLDDVFRLDLSAVSPLWPQSPAGSWRCSWAWSRGSSPRCG